jgi:hypothetical protein
MGKGRDHSGLIDLGLFLFALAFYIATLSHNLSIAHDGIAYLNSIEGGDNLFHPHHLLYNPLAFLWLRAVHVIVPGLDGALVVGAMNAAFGAGTLVVIRRFLSTVFRFDNRRALTVIGLVAFSFGFWYYSVCVEVYVVSLFVLFLILYTMTAHTLTNSRAILVGVLHGTAILFHQMHVLFACVVLYAIVATRRDSKRAMFGCAARYAASATAVVAMSYAAVMVLALDLNSASGVVGWTIGYAKDETFWIPLRPTSLALASVGMGRSMIGGHFIFAMPGAEAWLQPLLRGHWLADERFLVRKMDPWLPPVLLVLAIGAALAVISAVRGGSQLRANLAGDRGWVVRLVMLWFIVYSCFFLFWMPSNLEFWLPQSICAWILVSTAAFSLNKTCASGRGIRSLAGAAGALLVINGVGSMIWTASPRNDYYYQRVVPLLRHARGVDLVVVGRSWILEDYVLRFTNSKVATISRSLTVRTPERAMRELENEIDATIDRGGRVFVDEDVIRPSPEYKREVGVGADAVASLWNGRGFRGRWLRGIAGSWQLLEAGSNDGSKVVR